MCLAVAAGLLAGGQILQGIAQGAGQEAEGKARAAKMRADAAYAEQNAGLAELRAKEALGIAYTDSLAPEIASKRVVSTLRANAGSSGLSLGKGFITLQSDVDRYRYKAQDRILQAGSKESYADQLEAFSLRTSATNLRHGAEVETVLGKHRKRVSIFGGIVGAASTGFSYGASQSDK